MKKILVAYFSCTGTGIPKFLRRAGQVIVSRRSVKRASF